MPDRRGRPVRDRAAGARAPANNRSDSPQARQGAAPRPTVWRLGPNPLLLGGHYPRDVAAQCDVLGTLRDLVEALPLLHGADRTVAWARQRAKVRAFAATLIEREQKLVSEHQNDALVHPSVLEAHLAEIVPKEAVMVQESS